MKVATVKGLPDTARAKFTAEAPRTLINVRDDYERSRFVKHVASAVDHAIEAAGMRVLDLDTLDAPHVTVRVVVEVRK